MNLRSFLSLLFLIWEIFIVFGFHFGFEKLILFLLQL